DDPVVVADAAVDPGDVTRVTVKVGQVEIHAGRRRRGFAVEAGGQDQRLVGVPGRVLRRADAGQDEGGEVLVGRQARRGFAGDEDVVLTEGDAVGDDQAVVAARAVRVEIDEGVAAEGRQADAIGH